MVLDEEKSGWSANGVDFVANDEQVRSDKGSVVFCWLTTPDHVFLVVVAAILQENVELDQVPCTRAPLVRLGNMLVPGVAVRE